MSYAIYVERFFYAGTYNTPQDDYLRDSDGRIAATDNEADATAIAESLEPAGMYCLGHGEYASPEYSVRRVVPHPHHVCVYESLQLAQILGADDYVDCTLTEG